MKRIAIIGAGPAGLSTAYELLRNSDEYQVTIFEKEEVVGGLSKTFEFSGGRIDIGGHRFFSKNQDVLELWKRILPFDEGGMLIRNRKSHILWRSRLVEYPIKMNIGTIRSIGLVAGVKSIISYLLSYSPKRHINSLEDFYVQRFGKNLYTAFFKDYTEKLWGISAKELSPDWGAQRVQKISIKQLIASFVPFFKRLSGEERSLISEYMYPAFGSGQLWNSLANKIIEKGGKIKLNCSVERITLGSCEQSCSVIYKNMASEEKETFDCIVSSMPLADLINSINNAPLSIKSIAEKLYYRDMIVVGLEVNKKYAGTVFKAAQKDSWLYVQDKEIPFGRIQILNNWSPYAAREKNSLLLELEFFCCKEDAIWKAEDNRIVFQSMRQLENCSMLKKNSTAKSYVVKRIEKAYPIYIGGYSQIREIESWINKESTLICIGRSGQHRYNNMDHSVETGIIAARSIMEKDYDKSMVWNVNRKTEYIEE